MSVQLLSFVWSELRYLRPFIWKAFGIEQLERNSGGCCFYIEIGCTHKTNSLIQVNEGFATHFIKHQVFCLLEQVPLSITLLPKHLIQCCLPSHFQLPIQEHFIKERRVVSSLTMTAVYVKAFIVCYCLHQVDTNALFATIWFEKKDAF